MKGIQFEDKDGKILTIGWNADPLNYPPSEHFPKGWTWKDITEEEVMAQIPIDSMLRKSLPDSPEEAIRKLHHNHETLIEILEEVHEKGIILKKGDLKAMIANRMGGAK